MTPSQYRAVVAESVDYTDRDAYVSDLALSSIWGDPEGADIPAERIEQLGEIWDAAHRDIKGIASAAGMSCRRLADRFCVPYRTVEDWSAGRRECALYLRLMMQECLGLLEIDLK